MKLAILDRDGVINFDSDQYIKSPSEWRPIPGSIEAIARLNQHGYRIAVATNQSGKLKASLMFPSPSAVTLTSRFHVCPSSSLTTMFTDSPGTQPLPVNVTGQPGP